MKVIADSIEAVRFTLFTHYLSRDGGATWSRVFEIKDVYNGDKAYNLSSTAIVTGDGSTVFIPGSRYAVSPSGETHDLTFILRFSYEATSVATEDRIAHSFLAAPQPAMSYVSITTRNDEEHILRTDTYNCSGELVLRTTHAPSPSVTIPTDALPTGVYHVHVVTSRGSKVLPVCIIH